MTNKHKYYKLIEESILQNVEYELNDDGKFDFKSDLILKNDLKEIPFPIGTVDGNFELANFHNYQLRNGPRRVTGDFRVTNSILESDDHFPEYVGGDINVSMNRLTSLQIPNGFEGKLNIMCNFILIPPSLPPGRINNFKTPVLDGSTIIIEDIEIEFDEFINNDRWFGHINSNMTTGVETYYESVEERYDAFKRVKNNIENVILLYPAGRIQDIDNLKEYVKRSRKAEQHLDILDL